MKKIIYIILLLISISSPAQFKKDINYEDPSTHAGAQYIESLQKGIAGFINADALTLNPSDTKLDVVQVPMKKPDAFCPDYCTGYNLTAVCQSNLFVDLDDAFSDYDRQFKNARELREYIYDYRKDCKNEAYDNYIAQYSDYISQAASTFGVPEILLSCLLFRENHFLSRGTSKKKATGIAQIMPDTADYISTITKSEKNTDKVERFFGIVDSFSEASADELPGLKRKKYRDDYNFSRNRIKNYRLATDWFRYIDALKTTDAFVEHYPKNPWVNDSTPYFDMKNKRHTEVPPLAIGASALYLKDIMTQLSFTREGSLRASSPKQILEFFTAIAGAYNMGHGNVERALGNPTPSDPKIWVEKLAATSAETRHHMESIRNCMERGNLNPPLMIEDGTVKGQGICKK